MGGEIPGLTDKHIPKKLGPKRASKIRKLFNLGPGDDVRKYVVRSQKAAKEGKEGKRHRLALKARRMEKAKADELEYKKLMAQRLKEKREAHKKRRTSSRQSASQSVSSN